MKRFLTMLLAAISLLTFALMPISCDNGGTTDGTTAATTTAEAPASTTTGQDPETPNNPGSENCTHEYLEFVTEPTYTTKGFTTHTCKHCGDSYVDTYTDAWADVILQYDDYVTDLGGINVSANPTLEGDDCIEIITKDGTTYFHAKELGVVTVKSADKSVVVAVDKARLHLVVVMGQSNAGCHFANAESDVKCDLGTAYWWKTHKNFVDYTQTSTGFHAPLIAELRAQSVAAGAPEKPVMIWLEGITSKNGNPITSWATSKTDTSGTDGTVKMIEGCIDYYTDPVRADKYEIVESGMYWLQGEGGGDPAHYTECFLAMWQRLKDAGINYCAIIRVRRGVSYNKTIDDHNDIMHHGAVRAQMEMVNSHDDIYLATDITENWYGVLGTWHNIDISKYHTMMQYYGKSATYMDKHSNVAKFKDGILTTRMQELYGENNYCHYGKFGYGIIGADAAYNMYRALHGDEYGVVYSDTTGLVHNQIRAKAGETHTIKLSDVTGALTFRPECFSTAGTLEIKVTRGNNLDVTKIVLGKDQTNYLAVSKDKIATYKDVVITVTYTTVGGDVGTVTFNIVD